MQKNLERHERTNIHSVLVLQSNPWSATHHDTGSQSNSKEIRIRLVCRVTDMSDLQKALLSKSQPPSQNLVSRPRPPPLPVHTITEDADLEEANDSYSSESSVSSTGTIVASSSRQARSASTTSWHDYFDEELYLQSPTRAAKFHAYLTSPTNLTRGPLFVCHHGAGSTGLSFALFAKELRARLPAAGVLAVEARDHGSGVESSLSEGTADFSLDALTDDLLNMIRLTQQQKQWQELPSLVLIGHSLGGAVITNLAKQGALGNKLAGYAVIDVVEGSAIEALKSMQSLLAGRPSTFPSIEAAIEWHIRSRTIRNASSARVSIPALLLEIKPGLWTWRTDLAATQPFWESWFKGLSSAFLSGKASKLLVLAGTDRLDKELMIGQMQGKFQMQVFPEAGHFVQEDVPDRFAEVVVEFWKRNDRSALVLPPKVGDLLKLGIKV